MKSSYPNAAASFRPKFALQAAVACSERCARSISQAPRLPACSAMRKRSSELMRSCRSLRAWYCRLRARKAEAAALRSVSALIGRSSRTTLPSLLSAARLAWLFCMLCCVSSTTKGKSDKEACCTSHSASGARSAPFNASSEIRAAPAGIFSSCVSAGKLGHTAQCKPSRTSTCSITCASRPLGASTRMRSLSAPSSCIDFFLGADHGRNAAIRGQPGQHSFETFQRFTYFDALLTADKQLMDRLRVVVGAALDDGHRAVQATRSFEETQQDGRIAQIAQVDIAAHFADQPMLSEHQQRGDTLLVQIRQQIMHLQGQEFLARQGLQIGVQAVDQHERDIVKLDRVAQHVRKLARR